MIRALLAVSILSFVFGCAHVPAGKGEDPHRLSTDACTLGRSNQGIKGSVWMKLDSKEAKGQFPATVEAQAPDSVTLEVTNLLGSREALIQVNHGKYTVDVPGKAGNAGRRAEGQGSWGGIPLRWASELFLGRIPCPVEDASLKLETTPDGDLVAQNHQEKFVYHFRQWAGKAWPESLHWERTGVAGSAVDFKFDQPEDKSGAPMKWEAKSARGSVKLRWKDLQITH